LAGKSSSYEYNFYLRPFVKDDDLMALSKLKLK